jgi:hypothetical protein
MQDLKCTLSDEADACLSLGLPGVATHVINESSPLFNLSITTMARRKMEVCYPAAAFRHVDMYVVAQP